MTEIKPLNPYKSKVNFNQVGRPSNKEREMRQKYFEWNKQNGLKPIGYNLNKPHKL